MNIKTYFNNLPLKRKLLSMISLILLLTTLGSIAGMQLMYASGNRMLYQSMRGSISYTSSVIAEKLGNVEAMTGMIIADSKIQNTLSTATDETAGDGQRNEAYRYLSFSIPDYYRNFRQNGLHYIDLYTKNYTVHSDLSKSRSLPSEIAQKLQEKAHEAPGYPVWTSDYCNEYGLFLSRDIRRAKDLSLDTIGTLVVNVDLTAVINDSAQKIFPDATPLYTIYQDGEEIYHSPALSEMHPEKLDARITSGYGVVTLDGKPYFYAKGTIPSRQWEYLCLTSYETILRTQRVYLLLTCLIVLSVLALSLCFSNALIRPITCHFSRLIAKMEEFGKDETRLPSSDYDYTARTDEIGELHQMFDRMAVQVQTLIQKNYVNELLTKDAELKSLESQINPHFLYNTLESINWYAQSIHAEQISTMVSSLGTLLRLNLSQGENTFTLKKELETVKDYMSIISIRFGARVSYSVAVPEELYALCLPKLTLQPLVENAINYALEEMTESCHIQITGRAEGGRAILEISNNGSQFPEELLDNLENGSVKPHGFGIGLINIHRRIRLQFGPEYGLKLYNREEEDLAIVQISLPLTENVLP